MAELILPLAQVGLRDWPCVGEALVHHGFLPRTAVGVMDSPRVLFSRVYPNAESVAAALTPGVDPLDLADLLERGVAPPLRRLRPALLIGLFLRAPLLVPRMLWALAHLETLGRRMEDDLDRLLTPLEALDLHELPDAQLLELLRLERPGLRQALIELPPANALARALVAPALGTLRGMVARAGESPDVASRLLGGLTGLIEVVCAAALWDLASAARGTAVETALSQPEAALPALRGDPGAAGWLMAWDEFLARFGHRAVGEADVARPRWREDPAYPLGVVANYLRCPPARAPLAVQEARRAERVALTATIRARLWPLYRAAFDAVLKTAQAASAVSENTKYHIVRVLDLMRRAALVRGERMVAAARLDAPADVFFLTLDELASAHGDYTPLVRERRARFAADDSLRAPACVDARGRPIRERLPRSGATSEPATLTGLAVSPGLARGRVRCIRDAARDARLDPGEVLVAPFTDPAWTPLFLCAAAVVVEVGSLLSHASIVARELGLPCVVEVTGALDRLRDGELVEVDGSRGTVRRLDE